MSYVPHGLDMSSLSVLNGALVLSAAKRDRRRAVERLERLERAWLVYARRDQVENGAAPRQAEGTT
jgi:hypothetical protein